MKFLIDMPLSLATARWLVECGYDAVHVAERGMHRSTDFQIMLLAESEQRIVITADLDFPRLLATLGNNGPGLILFRGGDWNEVDVRARLEEIFRGLTESEIVQSILVVGRDRVRRRRLPIRPA